MAPMSGLPEPRTPAEHVFRLVTGYQLAQVVGTIARLGVVDAFASRARAAADVASELGVDAGALERLIRAGATAGLFEPAENGAWRPTEAGETLRSDAPGRGRDFAIAMTAPGHWLPWMRLGDAVRTGEPVAEEILGVPLWDYYDANPDERDHFAQAMSSNSEIVAEALPAAFDPTPFRTIVDVGGSYGVLLEALLRAAPDARGVIYDLPGVIDGARASLAERGLAGRVEVEGGDFFERVPPGGDLYLLKHILHDWSDERAALILRNARAACEPGVTLLVFEMLLPEPFEPSRASVLDLTMLTVLGGRERTLAEYTELLHAAGFTVDRAEPVAHVSMIVARAV